MKTIAKTVVAISILMISLPVIAGNTPTSTAKVHYKVQAHLQDVPLIHEMNIYVAITDGNNKLVAPPQLLRSEKNSYEFYESEVAAGTRVAQLIFPEGYPTKRFQVLPDSKSGKFFPGCEYIFNLFIKVQKANGGEE